MQQFSAMPRELLASAWRNRELIMASVKREVLGRYRGSLMGILWSFFNPLLMLSVYTLVFSVVFQARWNVESTSKTEFALVLFAGLMIYNLFAECISKAPSLILSNANYVKKVIYPLEILPWVALGSALFHGAVSLCVWLLAYLVFFGAPQPTLFYFPLIVLPFALLIMGCSWILASLGVFLRDVSQVIGVITTAFMFLSPIFYPASALPPDYQVLIFANPLTPIIEQTRDVLIWGKSPDFALLSLYFLISGVVAWLGFAWFQKTRKGFADVI